MRRLRGFWHENNKEKDKSACIVRCVPIFSISFGGEGMFLKSDCYPEECRARVDYLNKHYEYCYLESMHYMNTIQNTDTIITGLSYGLDGIESSRLSGRALNFSMHAQDLYYDFKHIKKAVSDSASSIVQCVITLGYYSLFYDLSLSSNKWKCLGTYMPLFGDTHYANYENIQIADMNYSKECVGFYRQFFEESRSFYGRAILREHTKSAMVTQKGSWQNMSASERDLEAYQLTEKHNRHIRHINTYQENVTILNEMIGFLSERGIRPVIVILPTSKEYIKYINPQYKEVILEQLEKLPYCIDFIDMNEEAFFDDNDILDSDHLNYNGALKATLLLDGILRNTF